MSEEKKNAVPSVPPKVRLFSLDALRGFDMFLLVFLSPLILELAGGPFSSAFQSNKILAVILDQLHHRSWIGFSLMDLIMPLFMFMAGAAIPYALAKYKKAEGGRISWLLWFRLFRRFCLLWIIGMMIQGNLLSYNLSKVHLYSNTLQAIAVGYLFSSIIYLFFSTRWQIIITAVLLLGYWAIEKFVHFDDIGGGTYIYTKTVAEWVDQKLMTGHWNCGGIHTWILTSMTFIVTTMTGVFAGTITRSPLYSKSGAKTDAGDKKNETASPQKTQIAGSIDVFIKLLVVGIVLAAAGYGWNMVPSNVFGYCPFIKNMWSPSMTLWSSGLSFLLLAFFYLVTDVGRFRFGLGFLNVLGTNALLVYIFHAINNENGLFEPIVSTFFGGLKQYIGNWYPVLNVTVQFLIIYFIIRALYKSGKFFRV